MVGKYMRSRLTLKQKVNFSKVLNIANASFSNVDQFSSDLLNEDPKKASGSWACSVNGFFSSSWTVYVTTPDQYCSEASVNTHSTFDGSGWDRVTELRRLSWRSKKELSCIRPQERFCKVMFRTERVVRRPDSEYACSRRSLSVEVRWAKLGIVVDIYRQQYTNCASSSAVRGVSMFLNPSIREGSRR